MHLTIGEQTEGEAYVAIVDDLEVNRRFLEKLSKKMSQIDAVRTFCSAREALHSFVKSQPDLIITDFSMPAMDAAVFLQRLRNIPGLEETPVIVVSANEKRENRRRALLSGATDFLTTPFDVFELSAVATQLLTVTDRFGYQTMGDIYSTNFARTYYDQVLNPSMNSSLGSMPINLKMVAARSSGP